jgi:hypothetical protein
MRGSLIRPDQKEKCATSVLWDFRERGNLNLLTISELWCPEAESNHRHEDFRQFLVLFIDLNHVSHLIRRALLHKHCYRAQSLDVPEWVCLKLCSFKI